MQPRSLHGVQLLNYVECDHLPAVSLLGWHHGSGERKGRARPSRAGPSRPALSRAPSPARPPSQRQTAISSRSREAAGCGSPLGPPGLQATQLPPQSTAAQCGTPCPSRVGPPPAGTCRLRRPQALHLSCFLPRAPEVRPPRGGVSAPSALRDWVARLSLKGRARPLALLCHHGGNMAAPPSPLCQGEVVAPSLLQNELYSDLQLYSVTWTSADLYRLL